MDKQTEGNYTIAISAILVIVAILILVMTESPRVFKGDAAPIAKSRDLDPHPIYPDPQPFTGGNKGTCPDVIEMCF